MIGRLFRGSLRCKAIQFSDSEARAIKQAINLVLQVGLRLLLDLRFHLGNLGFEAVDLFKAHLFDIDSTILRLPIWWSFCDEEGKFISAFPK